MPRLFEGYKYASLYAKFRPSPPDTLINKIIEFLSVKLSGPFKLALDVGCGSGQSTQVLAPHFAKVVGTDVSHAQIKEANVSQNPENVSYVCCPAYEQPCGNKSAELLTVCQAVHWLDMPKFYKEVDRILVPGGVLAVYGYSFPTLTSNRDDSSANALNQLVAHMYSVDTSKYWHPNRIIVDECYKNLVPAYPAAERFDDSYVKFNANVDDVLGYVSTWSGYQGLCEQEGEMKGKQLLENFEKGLLAATGMKTKSEERVIKVCFNYFLLLCRKPSEENLSRN